MSKNVWKATIRNKKARMCILAFLLLLKKFQFPFVHRFIVPQDIPVPVICDDFKIEIIRPVPPVEKSCDVVSFFAQIETDRPLMSRVARVAENAYFNSFHANDFLTVSYSKFKKLSIVHSIKGNNVQK